MNLQATAQMNICGRLSIKDKIIFHLSVVHIHVTAYNNISESVSRGGWGGVDVGWSPWTS